MKLCKTCKEEKPYDNFYKHKKGGYYAECKPCRNERTKRNWSLAKSRDKDFLRNDSLRKICDYHNITRSQYDAIIEASNYICKLCGEELDYSTKTKTPHLDHDHKTGFVRGVICDSCNKGLGHLKDDIDLLKRCIKYLKGEL